MSSPIKNEFRVLIRCNSKADYLAHLKARKKLWKLPGFTDFYMKHIDKNIDKSSLWEAGRSAGSATPRSPR